MDLTFTTIRNGAGRVISRTATCEGGCLYTVVGNQAPPLRWTVTYPDGDYGMTDTLREARAWAEIDHSHRHPEA